MEGSFLAFIGISVLVIVTPGPDTAITIRNTLLGHRTGGVFTALGISTGQMIWALATSAGLAALLIASEPLFVAVKMAGAAYLIFLGLQSLYTAWQPGKSPGAGTQNPARGLRAGAAFRQGLISDLSNPKMAAFFTSLLPQFAPHEGSTFMALIGLGAVFSAMTFVWLAAYAFAIARAGDWFRRSPVRRAIEAVTGTVLIALGIRVATEQR